MNIENMRKLASFLDTLPDDQFDNRTFRLWADDARTELCQGIAGWADTLLTGNRDCVADSNWPNGSYLAARKHEDQIELRAIEALGLTEDEATHLFEQGWPGITPQEAAAEIRRMIGDDAR